MMLIPCYMLAIMTVSKWLIEWMMTGEKCSASIYPWLQYFLPAFQAFSAWLDMTKREQQRVEIKSFHFDCYWARLAIGKLLHLILSFHFIATQSAPEQFYFSMCKTSAITAIMEFHKFSIFNFTSEQTIALMVLHLSRFSLHYSSNFRNYFYLQLFCCVCTDLKEVWLLRNAY